MLFYAISYELLLPVQENLSFPNGLTSFSRAPYSSQNQPSSNKFHTTLYNWWPWCFGVRGEKAGYI